MKHSYRDQKISNTVYSVNTKGVIMLRVAFLVIFALTTFAFADTDGIGADEDVFASWDVTLYVDVTNGSDANAGTIGAPLKTVSNALEHMAASNTANRSVRCLFRAGVYRHAPIAFSNAQFPNQAKVKIIERDPASTGDVIVTGVDIVSNWTLHGGNIYYTPWTNDWGVWDGYEEGAVEGDAKYISELGCRLEMIFVNDARLTQVLTFGDMEAGTYFVDEANNKFYAWGVANENLSDTAAHTTEVTLHAPSVGTINPNNRTIAGVQLEQMSNVMVKNITFKRFAGHNTAALSLGSVVNNADCMNVFVEDCAFYENNWMGLKAKGGVAGTTIRNITALSNGENGVGFGDRQAINMNYATNIVSSYNGWRVAGLGGCYRYSIAGIKVGGASNVIIDTVVNSNFANGYWFDIVATETYITNVTSVGNGRMGIMIEITPGPFFISNAYIRDNGYMNAPNGFDDGCGLGIVASSNISVWNAKIINNKNAQIKMVCYWRDDSELPARMPNGETQITSWGLALTNCELIGGNFEQRIINSTTVIYGDATENALMRGCIESFQGAGNIYYNEYNEDEAFFAIKSDASTYTATNFVGWQFETGNDATSQWGYGGSFTIDSVVASPDDLVGEGTNVTLTVTTTGGTRVVFRTNNVTVTEDTSAPFTCAFSSLPVGLTLVEVSVYDASDNVLIAWHDVNVFPADNGPIGYWRFDDVTSTTIFDHSGYGNDGALYCGVTIETNGSDIYAVFQRADKEYAALPGGLISSRAGSISFWMKTSDAFTDHGILFFAGHTDGVGQSGAGHLHTMVKGGSAGDLQARFDEYPSSDNISVDTFTTSVFNDNTWHHVAMTWDETNRLYLYTNGVLAGSSTIAGTHERVIYHVLRMSGADGSSGNDQYCYEGALDEIRLYNRVITATEADELFTIGLGTDTTGPGTITLVAPANNNSTSNQTPTLYWTEAIDLSGIETYEVRIDGTTIIDVGLVTNYTIATPLSGGAHTWEVRAYDGLSNVGLWSDERTIYILVDETPPVITFSPDIEWTNASFTLSLDVDEENGHWSTNSAAGPFTSFTTSGTSLFLSTTATNIADGYVIYYYGEDAKGNVSSTNSNVILFDVSAPVINITDGPTTNVTTNASFTLTLTVSESNGFYKTNDAHPWQAFSSSTNITITAHTPYLAYLARDNAGNETVPRTNTYTWLLPTFTLSSLAVSPESASKRTPFTFTVTYASPSATLPTGDVMLCLSNMTDGTNITFAMEGNAGSILSGKTYTFVTTNALPSGTYAYYACARGEDKPTVFGYSETNTNLIVLPNAVPRLTSFALSNVNAATRTAMFSFSVSDDDAGDTQMLTLSYARYGGTNTIVDAASLSGAVTNVSNGTHTLRWLLPHDITASDYYTVTLTVDDGADTATTNRLVKFKELFEARETIEHVATVNNPYRGEGEGVVFVRAAPNAVVTIYTISGVRVAESVVDEAGYASWDVRNAAGVPAAPGVYIARVTFGSEVRVVKIIVAR